MPSSAPSNEEDPPDLPLTEDAKALFAALSEEDLREIDASLLGNCARYWRKVARVVGTTMMSPEFRERELSDTCYAMRIVELVRLGKLEAEGNLNYMRYSEVRLPSTGPAGPHSEGGAA